ncbi:MAG: DinB family protein [Pyrinomonadaceae bacterium]|nr:DinB family protein [Pyrinomonadaceae bacterium]
MADLLEEFILLRKANLFLFRNFKETDWDNFGIASEAKVTVRALVYIMVGHARHHIKILKERYLNN